MSHIRTLLVIGMVASIFFTSCEEEQKKVTLESLLSEMTDRQAVTHLPDPSYILKQFSSYDRRSTTPGEKGWWANRDFTHFIREEENQGRREFVMFDAQGPGAVVRWWSTFAGEGAADGTVRIYIDRQEEPVFEGNILDLLSGDMLASEPLAASVSPETDYKQRGHNLYLPLPYNEHCKITYECDAVQIDDTTRKPSIYYNIDYRSYADDVQAESISPAVLEQNRENIKAVGQQLLEGFSGQPRNMMEESQTLEPGESTTFTLEETGKAISYLSAHIESDDRHQALRSTVLSVSFDGEETVWIPVGEFFGTGYQVYPSQTWYTSVSESGKMESYWLMPFREEVEIQYTNHGDEDIKLRASAGFDDYRWNSSSLYFGAAWHEHYQIHTAKDPELEDHKWHFDVNYVDLEGRGLYVGDALTIFNTVNAWWGEGDEKIYVDGEAFPSFLGTGTEDYYGYAWCRPEKFTHPFIAQPTGKGNLSPGMTVNRRYRTLDAIPFQSEIQADIELWHWVKTTINYAMSSFWYARPGVETNVKPDPEDVQKPVALKRSDICSPKVSGGQLEGENLEIQSVGSGTATIQAGPFGWSGKSQLWWRNADAGAKLTARFILEEAGRYRVKAKLTKAPDYGIVQLSLNGEPLVDRFNGYNKDGVVTEEVSLGTHVLKAGENTLSMEVLGRDDRAKPGNMAGIDLLSFKKVK
ncbi:MAG: DUF2961 domain-containing protein [Bacteroidales bacterium]|nr:DUF2961 domain-containing protein [Bacteroidales bacterium]